MRRQRVRVSRSASFPASAIAAASTQSFSSIDQAASISAPDSATRAWTVGCSASLVPPRAPIRSRMSSTTQSIIPRASPTAGAEKARAPIPQNGRR